MTEVITIHDHNQIDFDRPGKTLYEVAFHYDGTWGNALVPLAVINGTASSSARRAECRESPPLVAPTATNMRDRWQSGGTCTSLTQRRSAGASSSCRASTSPPVTQARVNR